MSLNAAINKEYNNGEESRKKDLLDISDEEMEEIAAMMSGAKSNFEGKMKEVVQEVPVSKEAQAVLSWLNKKENMMYSNEKELQQETMKEFGMSKEEFQAAVIQVLEQAHEEVADQFAALNKELKQIILQGNDSIRDRLKDSSMTHLVRGTDETDTAQHAKIYNMYMEPAEKAALDVEKKFNEVEARKHAIYQSISVFPDSVNKEEVLQKLMRKSGDHHARIELGSATMNKVVELAKEMKPLPLYNSYVEIEPKQEHSVSNIHTGEEMVGGGGKAQTPYDAIRTLWNSTREAELRTGAKSIPSYEDLRVAAGKAKAPELDKRGQDSSPPDSNELPSIAAEKDNTLGTLEGFTQMAKEYSDWKSENKEKMRLDIRFANKEYFNRFLEEKSYTMRDVEKSFEAIIKKLEGLDRSGVLEFEKKTSALFNESGRDIFRALEDNQKESLNTMQGRFMRAHRRGV